MQDRGRKLTTYKFIIEKESIKMNILQKVKDAIANANFLEAKSGIDKVIAYAYQLGRQEATMEFYKKSKQIFHDDYSEFITNKFKHDELSEELIKFLESQKGW